MTPPKGEPIKLRVEEAIIDDVGKGLARIDEDDLKRLGGLPGDVLQITGKRSTVARATETFPQYRGHEIIQIDGTTRENAGVTKDQWVLVERVSSKPAETIVLAPIDLSRPLPTEAELRHLVSMLTGMPLVKGDKVRVTFLGTRAEYFLVEGTVPSGALLVTPHTTIKLKRLDVVPEKATRVSYEDIGGLDRELAKIREMLELPLRYPDVFTRLGIEAPKGVLLHGPPGCGKTLIARAIANEVDVHFINVNGPEIIHKYYGESEAKLREVFEEAQRNAPSIVFFDEIDAVSPRRTAVYGDVEKRVVAQLLALMDGLVERGEVIVIGATNVLELVDPALRRPGRFDREIALGVPDRLGRKQILRIHTKQMPLAPDVDLERLSQVTQGYVGADIEVLCKEAGMIALRRILPNITRQNDYRPFETKLDLQVTQEDFLEAYKGIEPTATREFLTERPRLRFQDIGGLEEIKRTVRSLIQIPLTRGSLFSQAGLEPPKGILFVGPSGAGKTLMAKALAGESEVTLLTVDGATLFSKWLGETERGLREVFKKAKQTSPCILFLDELDALAPIRHGGAEAGGTHQRLVNQLVRELDGVREMPGIVVLSATNRVDLVDPALLGAGRFDYVIEFPLPDAAEREAIFHVHTAKLGLGEEVDLAGLATQSEGLTGADIESICKKATLLAIEAVVDQGHKAAARSEMVIRAGHFQQALAQTLTLTATRKTMEESKGKE